MRVRSLDLDGTVDLPADGSADPATVEPGWGRYVAGVVRELADPRPSAVGMDALVSSDVPIGSGLSSSAALEVACALALADVADWKIDPVELAQACRDAESAAVGVPCGIMDQLASIEGRAGSALLIDCRSLRGDARAAARPARRARRRFGDPLAASTPAPTPTGGAPARSWPHGSASPALRDATLELVSDDPLGRHVVTENERVLAAARALADADLDTLGRLLGESHASLRDDFGVSTPELDVLVEELVAAGALGARLTGAGFGGCVVAACDADTVDAVAATAVAGYRRRTGLEPTAFVCRAVDGASRFDPAATS